MNSSLCRAMLVYIFIAFSAQPLLKAQWRNISPPLDTDATFYGVDFYNENVGIAVGHSAETGEGVIARTTDGGWTWLTTRKLLTHIQLRTVNFFDEFLVMAFGYDDFSGSKTESVLSYDQGHSWLYGGFSEVKGLHEFQIVADRTAYAIGYGETFGSSASVLKTDDGGESWSIALLSSDEALSGISFVNERTGFIGIAQPETGGVLKTTDGGSTWEHLNVGVVVRDVWFIDSNTGYALAKEGLYRTDNGGVTWTGFPVDPDLKRIVFINAHIGYTVGASGKVLTTSDGGNSWTPEAIIPAADFEYLIWRGTNLYAVGNWGSVFHKDISEEYEALPAITTNLNPRVLDFGSVSQGAQRELLFDITNTGGGLLTVTDMNILSEGAAAFTLQHPKELPFELAPGATQSIVMRFAPIQPGDEGGYLVMRSNAVNKPELTFILSGSGEPVVSVDAIPADNADLNVRLAYTETVFAPQALICELAGSKPQTIRVTLADISGTIRAEIFSGRLEPGVHRLPLQIDGYPAGMYFALVETSVGSVTLPFFTAP